MGAYIYCPCGQGLSRMTFEQVAEAVRSESSWSTVEITCPSCGAQRLDDTQQERMCVLVDAIEQLRELVLKKDSSS